MKPRCYLGLGIALTASFVALMGGYTESQAKPMVECKDGQCVISEADWKRFQAYHKRVQEVTAAVDAQTQSLQRQAELAQAEAARCKSQLPDRET